MSKKGAAYLAVGLLIFLGIAQASPSQTSAQAQAESSAATRLHAGHSQAALASSSAASGQAAANSNLAPVDVKNGARFSAVLTSTLDARTAKPGDEVTARVTQNVKQHGKVVIHKGAELIGHVTTANAAAAKQGSSIIVSFDRLVQGNETERLNAVIHAVLAAPGATAEGNEGLMGGGAMSAGAPIPAGRAPAGGLVGGAVAGVGAAANTVGAAAGSVTHGAGSVLNGTSGSLNSVNGVSASSRTGTTLATPISAIHLNSEAQASSQTGLNSVLSTRIGNLRLNSGTQLQFRVVARNQ
jgi:hypothetical protein